MLMRPNKGETAVHGCHCSGDLAVRMRKVLARPWVGVRVCHLLLLFFFFFFFCLASYFLPAKAMQNNFREFEELVSFDLWIPVSDSGFRFLVFTFPFPIPDSGFHILGCPGLTTFA